MPRRRTQDGPGQAAAEAALALAARQHGRWVVGEEIAAAWAAVTPPVPLSRDATEGRWDRLLLVGLREGRVPRQQLGPRIYYVPTAQPSLPLPLRAASRRPPHTTRVLEQCHRLEVALRDLVTRIGRPVS